MSHHFVCAPRLRTLLFCLTPFAFVGITAAALHATPTPHRRGTQFAAAKQYASAPSTDAPQTAPLSSTMQVYTIRLRPGQDVNKGLTAFVRQQKVQAACILTCVGSLTDSAIRYANRDDVGHRKGHFEIVSLVGTLDPTGGHLHISLSDGKGVTFGGHVMDGNIVYTTAEIVIGVLPDVRYTRERDATFGYDELAVHPHE